jgi:hypothetical protein
MVLASVWEARIGAPVGDWIVWMGGTVVPKTAVRAYGAATGDPSAFR